MIQLVFDYQDMRYRNMSVEFEVTKEPEGSRVFFQPAEKHKSGTVMLDLKNGVPEAGKYLIHITLVPDQGERLDAHMSFKAGAGQATSKSNILLYLFFAFAGLYVLYLSHAGFKGAVDKVLGKAERALIPKTMTIKPDVYRKMRRQEMMKLLSVAALVMLFQRL